MRPGGIPVLQGGEDVNYGVPHVSLAALDPDGRVLSVFSFSRTFAFTGARVGWLLTPPGWATTLRSAQEAVVSCVNAPAQLAVLAAPEGDQSVVEEAREHYRGNLQAAGALLTARGIRHLRPDGAFYLWIDVSHASGGDVAAWCERFLRQQRVAVAPGSAFGAQGEGWIRVSAAARRAELLEGLSRLPHPLNPFPGTRPVLCRASRRRTIARRGRAGPHRPRGGGCRAGRHAGFGSFHPSHHRGVLGVRRIPPRAAVGSAERRRHGPVRARRRRRSPAPRRSVRTSQETRACRRRSSR